MSKPSGEERFSRLHFWWEQRLLRLLIGADHRLLLPASLLGGAVFLVWADTLARTVVSPTELPVGVVTAMCGGPFFLYLLRKTERRMFTS